MSLALCKALSALSFWQPPILRTFSSSVVRYKDAGHIKPTEELSIVDKEADARARNAAYQRAYRQRLRKDPEKWEKFKSAESIANKKQYERVRNDPGLSRRTQHAICMRHRQRKKEQDPIYVERKRERSRQYYLENGTHSATQIKRGFNAWTKQPWVCQLPWKTHTPIPSKDKIRRVCAACGIYRLDGTKLWWQRHTPSDPPLYDCQSCYMKTWPFCMPEGYEDVRTLRDLRKRKEELDSSTQKQTRKASDIEQYKPED